MKKFLLFAFLILFLSTHAFSISSLKSGNKVVVAGAAGNGPFSTVNGTYNSAGDVNGKPSFTMTDNNGRTWQISWSIIFNSWIIVTTSRPPQPYIYLNTCAAANPPQTGWQTHPLMVQFADPPPTLSGHGTWGGTIAIDVFCDANGNGIKDTDEKGIAGATVRLQNQVDPQPPKATKCSTAEDGHVLFDKLQTRDYKVVVEENTLPAGAVSTTGGNYFDVSLGPCDNTKNVLFGYNGFDCLGSSGNTNEGRPGCEFPFVNCTDFWSNEGWDNLIDGDETGWDGTFTAPNSDGTIPTAVLCLNKDMLPVLFNQVRIVTDNGPDDDGDPQRQATSVELLVSTTGSADADFTSLAIININAGVGEKTQSLGSVSAKYLKIKLLAPGAWAKFAQIVELQLFNTGQQVAIGQSSNSYNLAVLPETTQLFNAYPNPFNPQTTIEYNLMDDSNISIRLFNLQGREIDKLVESYQLAGFHHVVWDANRFSSGTYFIVMRAGQFKQTTKVILLK
jgi:hypothetical protein